MNSPVSITDLPAEIIAGITHPEYIGRSTNNILPSVCKYFRSIIPPQPHPQYPITHAAASDGHLSILRWVVSAGHVPTEYTMRHAAFGGHIDIVKYLHEVAGCPWSSLTTRYAAMGGHVDIIDYAINNGCDYCEYSQITDSAARNGHLHVLKYARRKFDKNCDMNDPNAVSLRRAFRSYGNWSGVCSTAIIHHHYHIVDYVIRKKLDPCDFIGNICYHSVERGTPEPLKLLVAHGHDISNRNCDGLAANRKQLKVLDWLYSTGLVDMTGVRNHAVRCRDQIIIDWCDSKNQ